MQQKALLILGMHRSGTSAVTGALERLGVPLGSKLYAPHPGVNDKGYFEHQQIAGLDDEVLAALGTCWDDLLPLTAERFASVALTAYSRRLRRILQRDFAKLPLFAVKDPRMCRLLPWWLASLAELSIEPVCLLMIRHPFEVAESLSRRDGFSREKALLLWLDYTLASEAGSRQAQRAVLTFEGLMQSPVDALARLESTLGVAFPKPVANRAGVVSEFLSPSLRHHRLTDKTPTTPLESLCCEVMQTLEANAATPAALGAPFEAFQHRHAALLAEIPEWLRQHVLTLNQNRAAYHLTWLRVARSVSHRWTGPVRWLERRFGREV